MILEWRRKAVALAAGFATVAALAVPPAAAQRADIETVQKRFNTFLAAGKYDDALVEWQKLEAAVKARFGTEHPNYALILLKVAVTYQNQGRYDDAEAAYKRAAAILEKALGANHPLVATAVALVAGLAVGWPVPRGFADGVFIGPFALVLMAYAGRDVIGRSTWLSRRWAVYLGQISFAPRASCAT